MSPVNTKYLEAARERINNLPLLINVVSRRVRQLNRGQRPLVKEDKANMSRMDLVLKEIAEGTLTAEIAFEAPVPEEAETSSNENVITL
jgi:DNA-directed RNA polymerase subunit omega